MSSLENNTAIQQAIEEEVDFEKKELLTYTQIHDLADCFMLPFNGIDLVLKCVNEQIRWLTFVLFEDITIYPGIFQEFKEKLKKTYWSSLLEPGTGIGAITSDAIGQQATQALLNTFHSVGTAKSGGPDGIKENISLSANRKILYSVLHMKNARMTFAEMMALKKKYIGISISDLLLNPEQSGESVTVNIAEEFSRNPFDQSLSNDEKMKIFNSKHSWWYCLNSFNGVYDFSNIIPRERTCLRLKFNIQKLYNYRITTSTIAAFINKYKFEITLPKKANVRTGGKRITEDREVYAVASPSHIGIVDIFSKNLTDSDDHILINLIHSKQFKNLVISGVDGINNFYAVSTGITRLLRDVDKISRFDEGKSKKGMWLYLENNRFLGIPYSRILSALDSAGIKYEVPHYNVPNSYNDKSTDLPFEYHSHKSIPELRTSMKLRAYLFSTMTNHVFPIYKINSNSGIINGIPDIDHYKSEIIGQGFDVAFYPYTSYQTYDGLTSGKKFKNRDDFTSFINKLDYRIDSEQFRKLFNTTDPAFDTFFTIPSSELKMVAFEIGYITPAIPATFDITGQQLTIEVPETHGTYFLLYYLFQMKYIDYQIITNLDYCNSRYVTQSLDSVLDTQFTIPYNIAVNTQNSLPDALRKYKISDVSTMKKPEKRIFIKTSMFLKDTYDFMGVPNRKVIINYLKATNNHLRIMKDEMVDEDKEKLIIKIASDMNETIHGVDSILDYCVDNGISYHSNSENTLKVLTQNKIDSFQDKHKEKNNFLLKIVEHLRLIKFDVRSDEEKEVIKKWDDSIKKIKSSSNPKPFDRFIAFLNKKLTEDELNYVYAETSGCNFSKSLTDPLIEGYRSICNHFIQVYDSLGLEGMKNCQNNDLIGMINSSVYISVEYMNFLTQITTFNGRNPMTSNGVSGQDNRDWVAMATFDSASIYVKQAALIGKKQSADSTSTCIVLGKKFKTGTGFVNVTIDKTKLTVSNKQNGISEKFIKLSGAAKPVGDLFMDDDDDPIYIPKLDVGKFPSCSWVYNNFITRDIVFYVQQGINDNLKTRLNFFEAIDCSELPNIDELVFNIEPNNWKRVY